MYVHYSRLIVLLIETCTHQNQRIFDIADLAFASVSDDEKRQYEAKIQQTGSYQGYKLRKFWVGESALTSCFSIGTLEAHR